MPGIGFFGGSPGPDRGRRRLRCPPGGLRRHRTFSPVNRAPRSVANTPPAPAIKLKRALFLSAFSALHAPTSRAYYDKKRAEKKLGRRPDLPRPTPLRCPLRHAEEQGTLPGATPLSGLTGTIETPPGISAGKSTSPVYQDSVTERRGRRAQSRQGCARGRRVRNPSRPPRRGSSASHPAAASQCWRRTSRPGAAEAPRAEAMGSGPSGENDYP